MRELICMIGLPRSGKSTYIDINLPNYQVVCADDIRLAMGTQFDNRLEGFVWAIHSTMIRAFMERGYSICIDSTNTAKSRINNFKAIADEYGYSFRAVVIDTPVSICRERNVGKGAVPDDVITRMESQLDELKKDPDFLALKRDYIHL